MNKLTLDLRELLIVGYTQIVKSQLDRDQKVTVLLASMEDAYSFVDIVKSVPEKIKTLDNVIKAILQQTFECAIFMQEYWGSGFASTWSPLWSDICAEGLILQRKH
jgi:hypothetical protein